MKKAMWICWGAALALASIGCQPEPVQCVCQCDGPPPEGAKITVEGAPAAAPVPAKTAAATPPAASPPKPTPPAPRADLSNAPSRASGRVAAEPGSGIPVTIGDAEKAEMVQAMVGLAKAAKQRDMDGMQKFTTARLGKSLADAVATHGDRLYRRTDIFSAGIEAGDPVVEGTNDVGDGNFDIQFKFPNGETAHVLMFKEDGRWVFNRL